ncbi:MAG: arginine--tRNA ligase [Candidatus Gracilibacteria bacterium]|nr:arginine--tRNA ligase [Candidatus Gracilibacteria bacterium]MDD2908732.1 arginine--tRNA ligase [Candidatus Gracilibacteria bacterium]
MNNQVTSSSNLEANNLNSYSQIELAKTLEIRDKVRQSRTSRGYVNEPYFLDDLVSFIASDEGLNEYVADFDIDFITRQDFGGDIVFKSTKLIKENKDLYLKEICPNLKNILSDFSVRGVNFFDLVEQKGIYVNAKINSKVVFNSLQKILDLKEKYGESSEGKGKDIVIDYSSPNAAKRLHTGHIRSTIIGHVLGNLYEASGYSVHRINYLNDWGGVGNLIEGLRRWENLLPEYEIKNDMLGEIYMTFRRGQKYAESKEEFDNSPEDVDNLKLFFGNFSTYEELKTNYTDFKTKADNNFKLLESGSEAEFVDWQIIIKRSLEDFDRFYNILDIHQDYLLGESLYSILGKNLIKEELKAGGVVQFNTNLASQEIDKINSELESGNISEEQAVKYIEEVNADIGGYVIMLDNFERYVVLKGNESTIYATRDLASIKHRLDIFNPSEIIYEVGQEQRDHFIKLFESAHKLFDIPDLELKHIYHGFYINDETKKKLSSRDGASNIMKFIEDTISYFYHKYDGSSEFSEEEKVKIAYNLGVGSIIFNDLRKDKKTSVAISSNEQNMYKQFEEAGGAYIIYTSCRAKSILRKYDKEIPSIQSVDYEIINDVEIDIIKKLLEFPQIIKKATRDDDPVKVTEYLVKLASSYNSFYNAFPVLKGDFPNRVIITKCVAQVLDNGLRILHINSLDRI